MRKHAPKRASSIPPALGIPLGTHISIPDAELHKLSSLPKKERNEDEFNQDVAAWLSNSQKKQLWLMGISFPEIDVWLREEEMSEQEAGKLLFPRTRKVESCRPRV